MSSTLHERAGQILLEALQRDGAERNHYVKEACANDTALRAEVESLLAAADESVEGLDNSGAAGLRAAMPADQPDGLIGRRVGRYTVQRVIAAGGMGVVYEAMQDQPRRAVALKVIRRGLTTRSALRRFEFEAQTLGQLHHPGIAQVYESGVHDDGSGGLPFFAMEYIRQAQPITRYADSKGLSARQRLTLFAQVCDAVHHGHQKGVMHRDLKPDNILVEASGQPKIIDFGVARATDADIQVTTMATDVGQLVGTLQYMSPEQCAADPNDIDTRSDVYGLGVVLYELLAGRAPQEIRGCALPEAIRIIREEEPTRLSTIDTSYRGDVETIVARALEKDRERRYPSAAELAADVRRCLADEPIVARPPSTLYQLQKFARRNRGLVAGVGVAIGALLAGVIVSSVFAYRAAAARDQAEQDLKRAREAEQLAQQRLDEVNEANVEASRQTRIAQAINTFLNDDLLAAVRPEEMGRSVSMQEVLHAASAKLEGQFQDEPEIEASIRMTLGTTFLHLGKAQDAEPHLRRAVELRREVLGPEHDETLRSITNLLQVLEDQGRGTEAEPLLVDLYETRRRVKGPEHRHTLTSANNLASYYIAQGRYAEAEPILVYCMETRQRLFGFDDAHTLTPMNNLGLVYERQGRYDQADSLHSETLAIRRRLLGDEHRETVVSIINLASLARKRGQYERAESLYQEGVAAFARELGPTHPFTLIAKGAQGMLFMRQGRYDDAERALHSTWKAMRAQLGPQHPRTLQVANSITELHLLQGRLSDAEEEGAATLEALLEVNGELHPDTLLARHLLAAVQLELGKRPEARDNATKALVSRKATLGEAHPDTLRSMVLVARIGPAPEGSDEVEGLLEQAIRGLRESVGERHQDYAAALAYHAAMLAEVERFSQAEKSLQESHRILLEVFGDEDQRTIESTRQLAALQEAWNASDPENAPHRPSP
jgi:tetratricopeptide (TPR) repeat protein/tRNA A-37 threonylcarbamoyl transferase component Bud32